MQQIPNKKIPDQEQNYEPKLQVDLPIQEAALDAEKNQRKNVSDINS